MESALPLDTATLAGLFTSSILYGVFLVLLIAALYVLLFKRKTRQPNYILVSAAVGMFILSTCIMALSFSRTEDAFIFYRDAPGGPIADLMDLAKRKEVARTALVLTDTLLGDSILIYRCWIVWGKNYKVIVAPLILLVASTTVDIMLSVSMAHLQNGDTVFAESVARWITGTLSLILAQNIIVTSLIVYRIWTVNMAAARSGAGSLRPVISIILESGAIYVATVFIFLMTYVSNNNAQYIMVDALNPMIGITFCILIVRVGLRVPSGPGTTPSPNPPRATSHPMQAISVAVSHQYHTDAQSLSDIDIYDDDKGESKLSLPRNVANEAAAAIV